MKILLIDPPRIYFYKFSKVYFPNIGLLSLASYLEKYGYEVKVVDMSVLNLKWKDISKFIEDEKPNIVGVSGTANVAYECMMLARLIKETDPSIITVFGGIHFSLVTEESLRVCRQIDYIVIGEGEITFLELVKEIEKGMKKEDMLRVKGIAFLCGDNYIQTPPRSFIEDLDALPMPAYHLLLMDRDKLFELGKYGLGCTFSRGCIYTCKFCAQTFFWKNRWRAISAVKIVDELELLNKRYKKRTFIFGDESFLMERRRVIEFIEELEKRKLDIEFTILSRVDQIITNKDLLPKLRNLGLCTVMLGIETYSQEMLDKLDKNQKVENIYLASEYIRKIKIPIFMAFVVWGEWGQNRKDILNLLKESEKNRINWLAASCITPWPGTPFFEEMKEKNRIEILDYRRYNLFHVVMPTRYLSTRKLERLNIEIYFRWWFNPIRILRNLFEPHRRRSLIIYRFLATLGLLYSLIRRNLLKKFSKYDFMVDEFYKRSLEYIMSQCRN